MAPRRSAVTKAVTNAAANGIAAISINDNSQKNDASQRNSPSQKKRHAAEQPVIASKRTKLSPTKAERPAKNSAASKTAVKSTAAQLNATPTTKLQIFAFGDGSSGQLGLGTEKCMEVKRPRFNQLLDPASVGVVGVAAGGMHGAAHTLDNKIFTWGVNDNGALGRDTAWDGGMREVDGNDGSDSDSEASGSALNPLEATPTAIPAKSFPPGVRFVQIVASDSATFALTDHGLVYGWGTFRNMNGIFGFSLLSNGTVNKIQNKPMIIPELKDIVELSAGGDFCLALTATGSVYAWGSGEQSQLGRRLLLRRILLSLVPDHVGFRGKKIVSIHACSNHAFAIDDKGDIWAWGSNNFGQTGISSGAGVGGSTIISPQKVTALAGKGIKVIRGGSHHSIGITQDGKCLVWGRMDGSQMGVDITKLAMDDPSVVTMDERGKPRILLRPMALPVEKCHHVAAGSDHNVVVTTDGKAYSWGFNVNYQCGLGTMDDIDTPQLIDNTAVRDKHLIWAGAGGQFSLLAAPYNSSSK